MPHCWCRPASVADTHGRKRIFQLGLTLFLIASAACGAATSVGVLVAARVLQALGAALLVPSSLALVLGAFPAERRAVSVSLWGAVGGLAGALGPSMGAAALETRAALPTPPARSTGRRRWSLVWWPIWKSTSASLWSIGRHDGLR